MWKYLFYVATVVFMVASGLTAVLWWKGADGDTMRGMLLVVIVCGIFFITFGEMAQRRAAMLHTIKLKLIIVACGLFVAKLAAFKGAVTLASLVHFVFDSYTLAAGAGSLAAIVIALFIHFEVGHHHEKGELTWHV